MPTTLVMFASALFIVFLASRSVHASDSPEDSNLIGILIDRQNGTLVAQEQDAVVNLQVERMFQTIQKMNSLLINMDAQFSSKMEALSKRVDALEANQGALRRSLIAEWTQISEQKFAKVISVNANWTEANAICSTLFATLATATSQKENEALTDLLHQSTDQIFWIGSRVQLQIGIPTDRFHNFANDHNEGDCAAVTREGIWKMRLCRERHPFVCQKTK
uniref:C-type lectin domain-containing protein n=1 Tax=Steinernema glaseri TaxID=37863 RepID=A0A1I7YJC1_9BILA